MQWIWLWNLEIEKSGNTLKVLLIIGFYVSRCLLKSINIKRKLLYTELIFVRVTHKWPETSPPCCEINHDNKPFTYHNIVVFLHPRDKVSNIVIFIKIQGLSEIEFQISQYSLKYKG